MTVSAEMEGRFIAFPTPVSVADATPLRALVRLSLMIAVGVIAIPVMGHLSEHRCLELSGAAGMAVASISKRNHPLQYTIPSIRPTDMDGGLNAKVSD